MSPEGNGLEAGGRMDWQPRATSALYHANSMGYEVARAVGRLAAGVLYSRWVTTLLFIYTIR
jgi:hypothetical protein